MSRIPLSYVLERLRYPNPNGRSQIYTGVIEGPDTAFARILSACCIRIRKDEVRLRLVFIEKLVTVSARLLGAYGIRKRPV